MVDKISGYNRMSGPSLVRKAVVVGAPKVGKSTAMEKAEGRDYGDEYRQTIGVDFHSLYTAHEAGSKKIHVWDIGGSPQYRQIGLPYLRTASMVVLMYDVSRAVTLDDLMSWHRTWTDLGRGRPALVVGNCGDKQDKCYGAGRAWARSISAPHILISAKTGEGIEEMIAAMFSMCDEADVASGENGNQASLLGRKKSQAARFCCAIL